ncbi:MAG TPA: amino acid adenylation domain-containing protein, partial [Candidatus Acidoferrales bacterium]|nr:amino acid adenylation domain-containing protein [Candidatus Acidoferrales bacterium]
VALTEEQTEIWLAAQAGDEASCAFNESVTVHLHGALHAPMFERAWEQIVARHDALRASFGTTGERMQIAPALAAPIAQHDFSHPSSSNAHLALRELIESEARTPFDLAAGPLVRAHLVRLSSNEHAFVLTAHHIICDGWSMNVILGELAEAYGALERNEEVQLPKPLAFSAYARRQAQRDPERSAKVQAYWLDQFQQAPPLLELPTDRPRPPLKTYNGATRTAHIEQSRYRTIKKGGARHGCTLFVTLLAAFDLLVSKLADQHDVVVGIPTAGQSLLDGEILVGHCVDFLPLRARLNPQTPVADFLLDVKRRVLDAYEHQQYTLGTLVRMLALPRERNRVPLAEVQFNLERLADGLTFGTSSATVEPNAKAFVNFDLFFNIVESDNGLRIDCDYNTDLYDAQTIDRWLAYYQAILDEIARDATQTIAAVSFLSASERALLARLNDTAAPYPPQQTLHDLIRATAAANPAANAVRFGDDVLTYAQLQRRIDQTANYLLTRISGPGQRIAVCLQRSSDLVVALLATLNAGCSYVPLDPTHPPARLRRILQDAAVAAIIHDGSADPQTIPDELEAIDLRSAKPKIDVASAAKPNLSRGANDPAYVIYTSGSTGLPKGVEIAHRSLVNVLTSMARTPGLTASDVFLALTTVSFDIAALELFLPLVVGATVVVASRDEVTDPFALIKRSATVGATAIQATPAHWQMLIEAGFQSSPSLTMLCGGEALSRELANRLLHGGGQLWNVYGPTETTIWSSCANIQPGEEPISIGTPIANTQFYVLDRNDQHVPLGVVGQLHIAGDGVARGYVNRPELNAEKFLDNPFAPGRMYRTGDAARINHDGTVTLLGRLDHQVKVRGFRIELGEIEAVVRTKTAFPEVVVIVREDVPGERRLVCYYTDPKAIARDAAALRALAAEELPEYMLPTAWVPLERMPLSPAGKIDRNALPAPHTDAPAAAATATFRPPQTPTEITLAGIWADVLHLEHVGLDDDFFALGGDSIDLFQVTARANRSGLRLAAKQVYESPTIASLAACVGKSSERGAGPTPVVTLNPSGTRIPFIYFHSDLFAEGIYAHKLAAALGPDQPVHAVAPHGTFGLPLLPTIESMARDYATLVRRVQPTGPYRLGGFCASGLVAYELARVLRAEGEIVDRLVLINASPMPTTRIAFFDALIRRLGLDAQREPLMRYRICYNLARLHSAMVTGPLATVSVAGRTIRAIAGRSQGPGAEEPQPFEKRRGIVQTENSFGHLVAALTYHPPPHAGDATLIWSEDQTTALDDPTRGWGALLRRVRIEPIGGGHVAVLTERIQELARVMAAVLADS